jgi:hypothetical protein
MDARVKPAHDEPEQRHFLVVVVGGRHVVIAGLDPATHHLRNTTPAVFIVMNRGRYDALPAECGPRATRCPATLGRAVRAAVGLEHFPEKWEPVFRRKCDQV